ncbi:MAG: hypothetical protein J6Y85_00625 [Alphaproteobacteria bacterium]|nr:hypothetical protein [Alphaproteobacteria bacterium]
MKKTLMALLLGTTIVTTPVQSYAVDAKTQSAIFYAMSAASIGLDGMSISTFLLDAGFSWKFGMDVSSAVVDVLEVLPRMKRKTHWKGIPDTLQAAERKIGNFEDLESYASGQEYLTETDVHAMALTTTGIEALFDDGNVNTEVLSPAVATSAAMTAAIQEQFGTPELDDVTAEESSEAEAVNPNTLDTEQLQEDLRKNVSDEDKALQIKRRVINKQKVSLTGVAKAELFQAVSATDNSKKRLQQLEGFVGRGESLSGQVKILGGLELELAGRLNMLDAVQANTLAVDAADALVRVK